MYKVLTIAGSDSGGGAGIQADLKTIAALGGFGTTAITSITVQNTLGVSNVFNLPGEIVGQQIQAVMDDIQPGAIKIGMISTLEIAKEIAQSLNMYPAIKVVLDPVMIATSGDKLISHDTIDFLIHHLLKRCALVTPNINEAEVLADMQITNENEMREAAARIHKLGAKNVLIKGGHLIGSSVKDILLQEDGRFSVFENTYIATKNLHGTGCTLSSAIACYLAQQKNIEEAVFLAIQYVHQAILQGKDWEIGHGNGPLNHGFAPIAM